MSGALSDEDLTIRISSEVRDQRGELVGFAGFNVSDVQGYRDSPKCNLLVFEVAFRAGFVVPLIGRTVGWGFPSSEMLAVDAADGNIFGRWAEARSRPVAADLNIDRENGHALVAVASSSTVGAHGHMAVIDWIDDLDVTRQGEIRRVSFLGWEANMSEGARYGRMHWGTTAIAATARFDGIFILELRAAEPDHEIALLGRGPRRPTGIANLEGAH